MVEKALVITMPSVFVYGPLCDAALRALVIGRPVAGDAASLRGRALAQATLGIWVDVVSNTDAQIDGLCLLDLNAAEYARLEYYLSCFGGSAHEVRVQQLHGDASATGFFAAQTDSAVHTAYTPWNLEHWQHQYGAIATAVAADIMRHFGVIAAPLVHRRLAQMSVLGAARVRALDTAPTTRRRKALAQDVRLDAQRQPYAFFFSVEEYDLAFRRFDASLSRPVTRAAFLSGDAVTVLPYDPVRDRVLVIEQFRAGPYARGDSQPWQLEAIAGRIDPGETAEAAARREAEEEAGLTLGALISVANYYPSPGICAEFLYSYLAVTDLPDDAAGVFGLHSEAEDIRGHLLSFDQLMAMVESGEVGNAPLVMTAFWLDKHRDRLRAS
ncbi:MAG: hypothetical protein RIR04_7 [Pseudomonadota bacterium]